METTLRDLRYALRILRENPGFTIIAVLALMLGIASTTVIFSVVDGVLLRPLPYPESERIVSVSQSTRSTGISQHAAAPANYLDWLAQNDVFSDMATSRGGQGNLTEGDRPERLRLTAVSASFFKVFGVAPILGRTLQPSDEKQVTRMLSSSARVFGGGVSDPIQALSVAIFSSTARRILSSA